MPRVAGASESGQPEPEGPDIGIEIICPKEFAGASMGQLQRQHGQVTGIDVQADGSVLIRASLPSSEIAALEKAIAAATEHRGKVRRAGR